MTHPAYRNQARKWQQRNQSINTPSENRFPVGLVVAVIALLLGVGYIVADIKSDASAKVEVIQRQLNEQNREHDRLVNTLQNTLYIPAPTNINRSGARLADYR